MKNNTRKFLMDLNVSDEEKLLNHIDKTIADACCWIQHVIDDDKTNLNPSETIKALAELISARASIGNSLKKPINQ